MIRAAGILYVSDKGTALFLKRGPGGDCPGEWCFPGGTFEPNNDKDIEACAKREAEEELGFLPKGDLTYLARRVANREVAPVLASSSEAVASASPVDPAEQVDFTTFVQRVPDEFTPKLNGEHVGWSWAPLSQPPEPLHPGSRAALARLSCTDELQVARMIAAGEITSPQKYENVWLFAIRITGTGAAYRTKHDEYVWRDPSLYMNDEFLARCNGLAVIMEHPPSAVLDTKEFGSRVVGSILLPYLRPEVEEVWGIAKIYDEPTADMMEKEQVSTSPSVVFRNPDVNKKMTDEDGKTILIEGKPSLLDHIAICAAGVWDKGGAPSGVQSAAIGDSSMTDEEKRAAEEKARQDSIKNDAEDKAKADAEEEEKKKADAKLDKMLACLDSMADLPEKMDSLAKRMDAVEGKKADAEDKKEEEKSEKKEDSEEKEEKEEKSEKKEDSTDEPGEEKHKPKEVVADKRKDEMKEDSKKADSEPSLSARLRDIENMVRPMTDADFAKLADAQEKAEHAFSAFGDSAPRPISGETTVAYRVRAAAKLQVHSPAWKNTNLSLIARTDSVAFDNVEKMIYEDAARAAERPVHLKPGQFQAVTRPDGTGRNITTFRGTGSFVRQFKPRTRRVQMINTKFDR